MKVQTTRFGELQVNRNDILNLVDGILGFEHLKKFCIVDPGDNTLILWLQSTTEPSIAFPIIEPKIFRPDYSVKLLPSEMASLELENLNNARVYCILTILPNDIKKMSANLKAPIIINNVTKKCRQIVLQDNKLPIKHEMYHELKHRIVNFTSDDSYPKTEQQVRPDIHSEEQQGNDEKAVSLNAEASAKNKTVSPS